MNMGTICVTGTASGIGAATKVKLESLGHKVIGVDLRNADVCGDISKVAERQRIVDEVIALCGGVLDGLVLGAGSGVGLGAVDVAQALGVRVIAAASTQEKRDLAQQRGAFATIDSTLPANEVKEEAKRLSGGGVDYLYDPVGGELGETCLRALTDDGQYLVIGFVAGIPKLPANQVLLRNRRVIGVDWGSWSGRNPELNEAMLQEVLALIVAGKLHPVEPHTYPLAKAAQALQDLEDRKVAGKIALIP